jgi:flagellar basal body-associated protein FliL
MDLPKLLEKDTFWNKVKKYLYILVILIVLLILLIIVLMVMITIVLNKVNLFLVEYKWQYNK